MYELSRKAHLLCATPKISWSVGLAQMCVCVSPAPGTPFPVRHFKEPWLCWTSTGRGALVSLSVRHSRELCSVGAQIIRYCKQPLRCLLCVPFLGACLCWTSTEEVLLGACFAALPVCHSKGCSLCWTSTGCALLRPTHASPVRHSKGFLPCWTSTGVMLCGGSNQ